MISLRVRPSRGRGLQPEAEGPTRGEVGPKSLGRVPPASGEDGQHAASPHHENAVGDLRSPGLLATKKATLNQDFSV